jgi:hypothetical protein
MLAFFMSFMEDLGIRDIIATVILEVEYEPKFSSASENSWQFKLGRNALMFWLRLA